MAEENKDQKTEDASSKRVRETEERGQFTNSRELTSAFILLAGVIAFSIAGRASTKKVMATWSTLISQSYAFNINAEDLRLLMMWILGKMGLILAPILFTVMISGLVANLIQTRGLKFSLHPLKPNWGKLNPLKGFGRIFSKHGLAELIKSLFKIGIVSVIVYFTIKSRFKEIPILMELSVGQVLLYMGQVGLEIMIKVLLVMVILAALDYSFQRFQYLDNLKMTKQEVKDERKETDGNPIVKQRIRSAQLQMARRRMMAAVPEADVVVTNPTHIAVAIKYDNTRHEAPVVVAKGENLMAGKIREVARENDVPIVEDKPLARALNKNVEIGQYIPANLFKAVAEILAYVYRLKGRTMV